MPKRPTTSIDPTAPAASAAASDSDRKLRSVGRAILLLDDARLAVDTLAAAQISCLALKGCALLGWVVEPGEREMSDVDLLVRQSDRVAARAALVAAGFALVPRPHSVTAWWVYPTMDFHSPRGSLVDIHSSIGPMPQFRLDHALLFDQAVAHPELGANGLRPSTEHLIVLMALDRAKDAGVKKATADADVARLLRSGAIDWNTVVAVARRFGCATTLGASLMELRVTQPALAAIVPDSVYVALRSGRARSQAMAVMAAQGRGAPPALRRLVGGLLHSDDVGRYGAALALYGARSVVDVAATWVRRTPTRTG